MLYGEIIAVHSEIHRERERERDRERRKKKGGGSKRH
jgi:hypothetical protein